MHRENGGRIEVLIYKTGDGYYSNIEVDVFAMDSKYGIEYPTGGEEFSSLGGKIFIDGNAGPRLIADIEEWVNEADKYLDHELQELMLDEAYDVLQKISSSLPKMLKRRGLKVKKHDIRSFDKGLKQSKSPAERLDVLIENPENDEEIYLLVSLAPLGNGYAEVVITDENLRNITKVKVHKSFDIKKIGTVIGKVFKEYLG